MSSERRRALLRQGRERRTQRAAARWQARLAKTPVREVTMTGLARRPARIVSAVRDGELIVLSKHKRAVAMIVPLVTEDGLVALDVSRVEGVAALADVFEQRRVDRGWSAFFHGRLFGKEYRRYRRGGRR